MDGIAAGIDQLSMQFGYFVGSVSPAGSELVVATGPFRAVEAAKAAGAEVVIVDTCGAVWGVGGRRLK
ncbi:MAG: hypothetical protein R6U70_00290 [Bacillota bacterium]